MALPKLFNRIIFHNNTTPSLNEDNENAMSKAIDDIDDRVIALAGTIMEDVPQIQEDIEELEEDFALIDEKIADATAEANRATTKANEAAASVISAGNKALISEGYAKGTQNGTPVGSSSPYYHNNAEYFKEQARSFTPTGYQDLVDDVAEAQEAITDIEGEKVSSNDAYVLRQCKGNSVDLGLVGGSVAWNQLVQNGNFASTNDWANNGTTSSASNNILSVASTTVGDHYAAQRYSLPIGHKILFIGSAKAPQANARVFTVFYGDSSNYSSHDAPNTDWNTYSAIKVCSNTVELSLRLANRLANATIQFKNVMLFDLTQMFGSTIADYIYSLEQATAGAGVAWFRKYFPNVYYGYQSGKIESVNVASRKVVGKNLLNPDTFVQGLLNSDTGNVDTGSIAITNWITSDYIPVSDSVALSGYKDGTKVNYCVRFMGYNINKQKVQSISNINTSDNNSYTRVITLNADVRYVRLTVGFNNEATTPLAFFATNRLQLEIGTAVTDYEPYKECIFPFDSSKELRGIPKLVNNKLSYDGDIYKADGSITRKYGIVDLSTLIWTYYSDNNYYISDSLANVIRRVTDNASISNWLLCDKTISNAANNVYLGNIGVAVASNGRLYYKDENTSSTTPPTGYLVYELATPTTESANAYQNPQRAFIDGTEEFIDAGVTASTRDVSIPVGNESEYNTSEVLPISQDYTDGAMEILKETVASSSDFADFKTKVAAL